MSETIDITPKSNVDVSLLTLVNDTALIDEDDGVVSLAAANVIGNNDVTITIQLLEADRVKALAFSSTPSLYADAVHGIDRIANQVDEHLLYLDFINMFLFMVQLLGNRE